MGQWYKVEVYRGHNGCSCNAAIACIFADDMIEVLDRYKTMRGVKRDIGAGSPFPNMSTMSEEEAVNAENKIILEGKLNLEKAKQTWYYLTLI
ncbi:hypothetical protein HYU07_01590 [Candidatus Woesearchaeota archaeon]|nr:hypothetical protein [Candidatus Woesearchaeota archaeon]